MDLLRTLKSFLIIADNKITLVEKKSEYQSNKKKDSSNTTEEKTSEKSDDPIRMYLREREVLNYYLEKEKLLLLKE